MRYRRMARLALVSVALVSLFLWARAREFSSNRSVGQSTQKPMHPAQEPRAQVIPVHVDVVGPDLVNADSEIAKAEGLVNELVLRTSHRTADGDFNRMAADILAHLHSMEMDGANGVRGYLLVLAQRKERTPERCVALAVLAASSHKEEIHPILLGLFEAVPSDPLQKLLLKCLIAEPIDSPRMEAWREQVGQARSEFRGGYWSDLVDYCELTCFPDAGGLVPNRVHSYPHLPFFQEIWLKDRSLLTDLGRIVRKRTLDEHAVSWVLGLADPSNPQDVALALDIARWPEYAQAGRIPLFLSLAASADPRALGALRDRAIRPEYAASRMDCLALYFAHADPLVLSDALPTYTSLVQDVLSGSAAQQRGQLILGLDRNKNSDVEVIAVFSDILQVEGDALLQVQVMQAILRRCHWGEDADGTSLLAPFVPMENRVGLLVKALETAPVRLGNPDGILAMIEANGGNPEARDTAARLRQEIRRRNEILPINR